MIAFNYRCFLRKCLSWARLKTRIGLTHGTELAFNIYNELLGVTAEALARLQSSHCLCRGRMIREECNRYFRMQNPFSNNQEKNLANVSMMRFCTFSTRGMLGFAQSGANCPSLPRTTYRQSFILLEKNDVVVGPAQDGGYYLIACKPGALPFSRHRDGALQPTRRNNCNLQRNNFSHVLLDENSDVDTHEDYVKWKMNV